MSMTRKHAEHLLEAYVQMTYLHDAQGHEYQKQAADALREVILGAMTEYRTYSYPSITYPMTTPNTNPKPYPFVTLVDSTAKVVEQ